jgi:iron(III) transport system substrate-binding protein
VSETPTWVDVTAAGFKEATGLDLILGQRGGSGTLEERLTGEMEAGTIQTDMLSVIDKNYFSDNADWWVDLSTAGLPNYETYPEASKWQGLCVDNKQSVAGILYNNELVPAENVPTTWTDLLDPYWQGKLIMVDPRASAGVMGWMIQMQIAYGDEFLTGLAAQNPDLAESSVPSAEGVASGAYEITVLSPLDASSGLRSEGAPLTHVIPEGPGAGSTACMGVLKDAQNPNAALVLLNYIMSAEAQSAACEAGIELRSPVDAPGCLQVPEGWQGTPIDPETGRIFGTDDEALRAEILSLLGIE